MINKISLKIGGIDRSLDNRKGSFSANDRINARTTFSFGLYNNYGSKPIIGQPVEIEFDNYYIYGSVNRNPQNRFARGVSDLEWTAQCVDNHQLADKRLVAEVYEDMTDKEIIEDIITNYLSDESITAGDIQESITIDKIVFNYKKASDCLDEISELSGLQWQVNYDKSLDYFGRATSTAPWEVYDGQQVYDLSVEENRQDYRNKQYIRGGMQRTASKVKTFKGDGETQVFTLDYPLAEQPTLYINDVEISGSDIGLRGPEEDKKWYYQIEDKQISQDDAETVLADTDVLKVEYVGLFPLLVAAESGSDEINERAIIENSSGIYESIVDKQELDTREAALSFANGKLRRYGINQIITYKTEKSGLKAGMIQHVESEVHDIDDDYLIEQISIRAIGDGKVEYTVKLISGESVGGCVQFFNNILKGQRDFVVRENEVIVRLRRFQETLELDDAMIIEEIEYWVWDSNEGKRQSDEGLINSDIKITGSDESGGKWLTLLFGGVKAYETNNNETVSFAEVSH